MKTMRAVWLFVCCLVRGHVQGGDVECLLGGRPVERCIRCGGWFGNMFYWGGQSDR